jgi:hypothetical protein
VEVLWEPWKISRSPKIARFWIRLPLRRQRWQTSLELVAHNLSRSLSGSQQLLLEEAALIIATVNLRTILT